MEQPRYAYGIGGTDVDRVLLTSGEAPLISGGHHPSVVAVATAAANSLRCGELAHVEPGFLSSELLHAARRAAAEAVGGIDGVVSPLPDALASVVMAVDALRAALSAATGRPLLESAELQVATPLPSP